jgi:hypothetical protein
MMMVYTKGDGMTTTAFETWMDKVDAVVVRTVGLSIHDLADQPFYDWFVDGITPAQAARMALADEGWGE